MSIAKLVVPKATIELAGLETGLQVRGLSVNDFKTLINLHRAVAISVFDKVMVVLGDEGGIANGVTGETIENVLMAVVEDFPLVLSDFIALACDDIDNADEYTKLPVVVQCDAVQKIVSMTFGEEDQLKKLLATLTRVMGAVKAQLDKESST